MVTPVEPPQNPAGPEDQLPEFSIAKCQELIQEVKTAPANLRAAVSGLNDQQLETRYRNWTIRQITHHVGDSHLNSIIRFKWALCEDNPMIKAYEEGDWVQLSDAKQGDVEPSLALLDGVHAKWAQLLESMTEAQFMRTFRHPQSGATVTLWAALHNYAWHGKHHTAQILWLREKNGW